MSPVSSRDGRLHAAMAGRGNPYAVLTGERLPLLRALHDDGTSHELAAALGLRERELAARLCPLVEAGFVELQCDVYAPMFVMLDAGEVRRVDVHALEMGQALAARLLAGWPAIEREYAGLAAARGVGLVDLGFLLVGDRVLDIGLLDALAAEGTLMPPAPARPAPDDPDAHYYLWMIEGTRADLGQYGQRTTLLPWPEWRLLTFGRYGAPAAAESGSPREELESAVLARVRERSDASPVELGGALEIPVFDRADTAGWDRFARAAAGDLLNVFLTAESSLRALWATTRAGARDPAAFGEFFCWYDHLAYAHGIDALVAAGAFALPAAGYAAGIWQEAEDAGAF